MCCFNNEKYVKHDYVCEFCNKKFFTYKHAFAYHVNRCSCNPESSCYIKEHNVICIKCGNQFTVKCTDSQFEKGAYTKYCTVGCRNSHHHSDETKEKISQSLRNNHQSLHSKHDVCKLNCICCGKLLSIKNRSGYCINCIRTHNKEFRDQYPLSDETKSKLSAGGRKGVATRTKTRRSKNEIAFCNLCEQYFSNVEHNVPIFNGWDADVIIHDIKYAVLWNGKWHYEKITANHSVEQVQNRDRIKINEIIKCGYTPYIIKDVGKHKESFVREEFDKFIKLISIKD